MAKSRKRKGHNQKVDKRNNKAAREIMHEMKREHNMQENIEMFKSILKEFAENQQKDQA
jgi:hypothetical protein